MQTGGTSVPKQDPTARSHHEEKSSPAVLTMQHQVAEEILDHSAQISARNDADPESARTATAKRHFGPSWRRHLAIDARFTASYQKAMDGDSHSIFELLDVLQDCQMTYGAESQTQITETFLAIEPSPIVDTMMEIVAFLFDDCRDVWEHFPVEAAGNWKLRHSLIDSAAAGGSATAQLMQLERERWQYSLESAERDRTGGLAEAELLKISDLLNDALRTKDHRAFAQARSLFNHYEYDKQSLHVDFWNNAVCSYDPYCDLAMFQASDTRIFSHEIDTINEAIRRLDRRLASPNSITFQKMFSSPLQMPDGSMWFEYDD